MNKEAVTRDTRITRRERDAENRWREASRIRSDRAWSSSRRVVAFPIAPTFSDDKRSAPRSRCIHGGARTSRTSRRCLRGAENGSTRSFWPHRYIASRSALHRDVKGDVWVSRTLTSFACTRNQPSKSASGARAEYERGSLLQRNVRNTDRIATPTEPSTAWPTASLSDRGDSAAPEEASVDLGDR